MSPRSQHVEHTNATLSYGLFNTPQLTECKTDDKMHKMGMQGLKMCLRMNVHYKMNNNNLHCFTEVVSGYKNFEVKIGVKMCLEFIADLLIVLFLRIHDHDV